MKEGLFVSQGFTPGVETRELTDGDLDRISGGYHHAIHHVAHAIEHVASELAAPSMSGGTGIQATGPLPGGASFSGSVRS